jgi:hypothetical protein
MLLVLHLNNDCLGETLELLDFALIDGLADVADDSLT